MSLLVRKVRGAQAEGAAELGLVKVTRASAQLLANRGAAILIVGCKVAPFHFFGGWRLAHWMAIESGADFDRYANSFEVYLEPELGHRAAFFVERGVLAAAQAAG